MINAWPWFLPVRFTSDFRQCFGSVLVVIKAGWPRKPEYQIPWHFHDFSLTLQADSRVYAIFFTSKKHGRQQKFIRQMNLSRLMIKRKLWFLTIFHDISRILPIFLKFHDISMTINCLFFEFHDFSGFSTQQTKLGRWYPENVGRHHFYPISMGRKNWVPPKIE